MTKHLAPYQFKAGEVSANPAGKPKGTRNKLQTRFLDELISDWNEHGAEAIRVCRIEKPDRYLQIIASLMPKELELDVASYVARVPNHVENLDQWIEQNQDLITDKR